MINSVPSTERKFVAVLYIIFLFSLQEARKWKVADANMIFVNVILKISC